MTVPELIKLVNTVYSAVNKSDVGPVYVDAPDGAGSSHKVFSQLAYNTYLTILSRMVPCISETQLKTPPDPWQQDYDNDDDRERP